MTDYFNPAEFANIARAERDFWWYRGMRAILSGLLDRYLGGRQIARMLETGCGTGYLSRLMQQERGWPVVPLDISAEGLRFARAMHVDRMVQADALRLPFRDATFDALLSIDVLVHIPRGGELEAARELARVLVPGGLLVLRTAALDLLRSRHSQFAGERQRFTRARLDSLFQSAGFRVLRCTYANTLLLPVALAKFRVWEPLLRQPAASGVAPAPAWLDRALLAALAAESHWIAAGHDFPVGQSLFLIGEKA